jgi:hypothetical protein
VNVEPSFVDQFFESQDVVVDGHLWVSEMVLPDCILCFFLMCGIKELFVELSEKGDPHPFFVIYCWVELIDPIANHLGPSSYLWSLEECEGEGNPFDVGVESCDICIEMDVSFDSFNKVFSIPLIAIEHWGKVSHGLCISVSLWCGGSSLSLSTSSRWSSFTSCGLSSSWGTGWLTSSCSRVSVATGSSLEDV